MLKTAISLPYPEFEFNEFEQVSQTRQKLVQLSACLNLKTLNKKFKWHQLYLSHESNSLNSA